MRPLARMHVEPALIKTGDARRAYDEEDDKP
jgi:hypothetical protein